MIKRLLYAVVLWLAATTGYAQEIITVVNAQGPSQSMTPQIFKIVDTANSVQSKYKFVLEFKTGGFESIGIRYMLENPAERIATITNSVIESVDRGFVNLNDIVPVFSHGDACWAVVTNFGNSDSGLESIRKENIKELVVGGPAIGGAAHLVALEVGRQYQIPVRYIVYKSNYDAMVGMAAGDGINFVMDRLVNYQNLANKNNSHLQALGINCATRHGDFPMVKTLKEQKLNGPYIWQFTVASVKMPEEKRNEIAQIFALSTKTIGQEDLFKSGDFVSQPFSAQAVRSHYDKSIGTLLNYRKIYAKEIQN